MKKITNSNYQVLGVCYECACNDKDGYLPNIYTESTVRVSDSAGNLKEVLSIFYKNSRLLFLEARHNIDYLVEHLFQRIDFDKTFREKCFEVAQDIPETSGIILLPSLDNAIVYSVALNETDNSKIISVCQMRGRIVLINELAIVNSEGVVHMGNPFCFTSVPSKNYELGQLVTFLITYLIFKHYAEVQTLEIKRGAGAGKKVTATLNEQEYQTTTYYPVTVIDSKWFTTVCSEGFAVTGHWRRQWYATRGKHGVIWINPYEKSGYTRKAKIENQ